MGFLENFFGGPKSAADHTSVLIPWIQLTRPVNWTKSIDCLKINRL